MQTRRTLLAICAYCLPMMSRLGVCQDQATDDATARAVLRARGLSQEGHVWITSREASYRRAADALDLVERRHQQAVNKAADVLARNEQIRAALAAAEEAERAQKKQPQPPVSAPTADPRTANNKTNDPNAKLKSTMPDVTGHGEQSPLQLAMIELAGARTAAQLAVLKVIHGGKTLDSDYSALRSDSRVTSAIKQIEKAKLGPLRSYQRDLGRAQSLAPSIFSAEIPCFVESGRFRLMAILNEAHPVTLSIDAGDAPIRITTSVAQRLGIAPSNAAQELRIGERSIMVRPVVLESVRLGPALLKKVSVLVLPPEAEDLGSWISTSAINGWNATLNERGMALVLSPKKSP